MLTTINMPKKELGNVGMNMLLDIVEGKIIKNNKINLPTRIVERESVIPYIEPKK